MRKDLHDRLPIVYAGKPVEEWYRLYCQAALRVSELERVLAELTRERPIVAPPPERPFAAE
jgi:hypothetical protein